MRTTILIGTLACAGAVITLAIYAAREGRAIRRPSAAEAATDVGES